ncbi:hypothetical protein PRIPAC_86288 [Pristionchus pacificus]|uniref:Uncharacterized protein n=1 Tax=Pristionchus pacificus TaxID=54126 RepID=A0A454XVQ7_PRIPA|nr:hypothetical protein PRIPAC_86288 [Pristionchus pacificus]|eukprot:PDM66403.1 hypothetical protein PRIPAC_47820 [Pristionchus pacificus]
MSGCIDQIACSCNVDWDGRRNGIASVVAGALFFSAWWIVLDTAMVVDKKDWNNLYFILTISSSVGMVLLNSVSNSQVRGDSMNESVLGVTGARLWMLLSFGISFACVFAAVGLLFKGYIKPGDHVVWPGVTLLIHNLMIFAASLVYKFGRVEDLWMI